MVFYDFQIQAIRWIQDFFSHPILRYFFDALRFFDSFSFYFILVPLIWIGFHKTWGVRFYYLLLTQVLVLHFFKDFFAFPRPYFFDPQLALADIGGYGFPSGGATASMMFAYLIIYFGPSKTWVKIFAINYCFWVSFSRVYLGVHFFTDILGGWVLGYSLGYLFAHSYLKIEKFFQKNALWVGFLLSQIFALFFLFLKPSQTAAAFSTFGVGAGLTLSSLFLKEQEFDSMKKGKSFVLRFLLAFLGILVIYLPYFLYQDLLPILYYVMGLWISFFIWPLYKKLKMV